MNVGPGGSVAVAGVALARNMFASVPATIHAYEVSATLGDTVYTVEFTADQYNAWTVESAVAKIGQAAFASLMADSFASLQRYPASYLNYELSDESVGGTEMGYANVSYIIT